jgi:hypothetical protein
LIFNQKIVERYSLRYSILDLYRILLQNIPDNELLHALNNKYLPLGKIFYAREYDLLLQLTRKLSEIWLQLPNKRFNLLPDYVEKIHKLTSNYPETPNNLEKWAKKYLAIYSSYYQEIKI